MNIPKAYIGGFQKAAKSPRMLFILYFSNLLMALLLALPFMGFLKIGFGSSVMFENLLEGFNFTSFSNLMYYNSDGISTILGSIKWFLLAYFLLNLFLTGGIIRTLNKEKFTTNNFFSGAAYNFFRFLGLSAVMILVQIVFILLVYVPLGMILGSFGDKLVTEITYYYWVIGAFTFHLLLFLLISMIGDYAKFYLVLNDSFNIFKGFWKGVRYVFKHFLKTYFLYLMLLFIPAVIMYVYWYYEKDMKMATGVGILIVFALQQGFIFLRVFLRVWVLSSQFKMYADDFIKSSAVQDIVFSVVETSEEKENDEKTIEETEETTASTKDKSEYEIDFSKTFSPENELLTEEQTLSEEEMLKRVEEEEQEKPEVEKVTKKEENIVAKKVEEIYDEELYKEEIADKGPHFEEDGTEEVIEGEEEITELDDDDEFEPEHVIQDVTKGVLVTTVEEEAENSTDKKKVDDDLIEFEL